MKLTVPTQAEQAIKALTGRIREICPYASPSASAITAAILTDFQIHAGKSALERVADQLVSPRMKRHALLHQLAELSRLDENHALQVLEKSIRKLDRSNSNSSEKHAEQ